VVAVFVDFLKTSEIQFLIWRRPMRSYSSLGTRHHCPMEVGAYAVHIAYYRNEMNRQFVRLLHSCLRNWTCISAQFSSVHLCTGY